MRMFKKPANIVFINHEGTPMSTFKKGDRVQITTKCDDSWNASLMDRTIGKLGTVVDVNCNPYSIGDYAEVEVDGGLGRWVYASAALKPADAPSIVGSRVEYIGNANGKVMNKAYVGEVGTVVHLDSDGSLTVKWDSGRCTGTNPYVHNLRRLVTPSPDEVDRALTVLKAAGQVQFTPTKPAFVEKRVTLNSAYVAIVGTHGVTVGCQTFSFAAIEEVAEAVAAARAYNKES